MNQLTKISIALLFILSGLTSLVYESLWIRTLSLSLGSTSTSMSLVLSIFFFGMSMGSYLSGTFIDKIKSPLKAYGLIEAFIGIYSLFLIYLLTNLSTIVSYIPGSHSSSFLSMGFKAVIVLIILGPPTLAMGATLPLLIRTLSTKKTSVGKNVSILYAVNTLGAVLGAYASGFILIPKLGVYGANHLMVVLNLLIFAGCFIISRSQKYSEQELSEKKSIKKVSLLSLSPLKKSIILSSGLVGLASIGAEVIWSKYLGIFLGTNIYGLSLILSIFLFGIAAGSYALSLFIESVKDKLLLYINLLSLVIASILLSTLALNWAPVASNIINYYLPLTNLLTIKSFLVVIILLFPTSLLGALLPLAVSLVTTDNESAPAITGKIYAVNTWGAILGSALSGLWLIPTYGSGVTLIVLNVFLLAALLAVVYFSFIIGKNKINGPVKLILAIVLIIALPSVKFENIIKSAYYTHLDPGQTFAEVTRFFTKDFEKIVFLKEGKTAIISLNHEAGDNGKINKRQLRMKTNGLNESYYDRDYLTVIPKYEGLLGLVPFLHHKNPQSAFIVGYGGGYTTDVLTSLPIPLVHVAEIEESVLDVANFIHEGKNPIVLRKNLKLEIEDARFVLNAKKHGPYDIIVSQPSHSWISGVANLFTQDFFEIAKSNLSKGGVFAQWLNLYNMDLKSLKSILATYYKTFPYGVVYTDQADFQVILLGSMEPLKLDLKRLRSLSKNKEWQERLTFLPFENEYDFISNFSMGREKIVSTTAGAPMNTDENAYAEIRQSSLFYSKDSHAEAAQPYFSENYDTDFGGTLSISEDNELELLYNLLKSLSRQEKYDKYFKIIGRYEKKLSGSKKHYKKLAEVCYDIERYSCAIENYKKSLEIERTAPHLYSLISTLIQSEQYSEVIDLNRKYKKISNASISCLVIHAQIALGQKLSSSIENNPSKLTELCGPYAKQMLGSFYLNRKQYKMAIKEFEKSLEESPTSINNLGSIMQAHLKLNNYASVTYYATQFNDLAQTEKERLTVLVSYYEKMGWKKDSAWLRKKLDDLEK